MGRNELVKRKEQLHVLVDSSLKERVKREALRIGVSMSAFVNVCILCFLDRKSGGER